MSLNQRPYGPGPGSQTGLSAQNINVQAVQAAVLPASVLGGVGTTETVVLNPALAATAPAGPQALIASLPNTTNLEQIPWDICASGNCVVNALTTTLTIKLYSGISTTVGSDTLLKTSGAITPTHLSFPWLMIGKAIYDSTSGNMQGTCKFLIDNQVVAESAWAATIGSVLGSNTPVCNFVLSATFGAANAANTFNVAAFSIG